MSLVNIRKTNKNNSNVQIFIWWIEVFKTTCNRAYIYFKNTDLLLAQSHWAVLLLLSESFRLWFVFIQWLRARDLDKEQYGSLFPYACSFSHLLFLLLFWFLFFSHTPTWSVVFLVFNKPYRQISQICLLSFLFHIINNLPVIIHEWPCHIRITCLTASPSCSD